MEVEKKAFETPNMVFKPYLVLKEPSLVKIKIRTRKLAGGMQKEGWISFRDSIHSQPPHPRAPCARGKSPITIGRIKTGM
jgi:hypothetical protein